VAGITPPRKTYKTIRKIITPYNINLSVGGHCNADTKQHQHTIKMLRKILGVFVGYAIFVATSLALFKLSGQNPHEQATISFQIFTAVYGVVFSFLSGLVLQLIAKTNTLTLNYILAVIIAGFATFSLIKAGGSNWTQLLAIFIFAPVSVLGGLFYLKRNKK
jgi:NAD/NADP transhydrogenase beta subunit